MRLEMKKFRVAAILLIAVGAMVVFLASKKFANPPGNNPTATSSGGQTGNVYAIQNNSGNSTSPAGANTSPENLAAKTGKLTPPEPTATNVPPEIILQNARRAIVQYAQVYGGNPVGTNPEITAALMGDNPRHINFITPDSGLIVNDNGEMLDAWGTPLFFHQISGHETEIRSAGMDKKMWTFDDLVLK
jgi:hypothetical protein